MKTTTPLRPLTVLAALLALLQAPGRARGQETDDRESREEALLRVIGSLEAAGDSPSILGGIDLRRATEAERKAARVLKSSKLTVDFQGATLDEVLQTLRAASGLAFVASAKAREAAREADLKVTFAIDGLPLENALNLLSFTLRDYRFVLRYGAIMLVKNEEAKARRVLRIYDVSDLVRPPPDFPAPPLGLDDGKAR
jgi:hypothetical protein